MRFCFLSVALVLFCGWFNPLPAQVQNLTSLKDTTLAARYLKKGKALTLAAKYDSSTFYLEAAKSIYEKLAHDFNLKNINVNTVQCYNWIGWNLKSQGKYYESIRQLNQALQVGLKKLGEIHGVIAQTHSNMGGTYWTKGDYQQALKNYQKSLVIRNKFFGAEHPSVAKSYQGIGMVYNAMGDYERALKCHQKSLTIRRKLLKVEDINIAHSYNEIGIIWFSFSSGFIN